MFVNPLSTDKHVQAFILSVIASFGTFIGGILVVTLTSLAGLSINSPTTSWVMGVLQSFSGGVMLYMTFFDLVPESVEDIGKTQTLIWFFVGVVLFMGLMKFIPDEHDDDEHGEVVVKAKEVEVDELVSSVNSDTYEKNSVTAGESSLRKRKAKTEKSDIKNADELKMSAITSTSLPSKQELLRTSLITFIALAAHNMPEGLSVYLSSLTNPKLGLQLTVAILMHNIPEGMAVAIPLWAATSGSTFQVLFWTLLNGLAEPFGVLVGASILGNRLTQQDLSRCLAAVAGVMACISLNELQPMAIKLSGKDTASISLFVGMFLCFVAIESLHHYMH
ncbi:hypothetical protein HK098_004959 [Nowakowskiella sp. JEL0407]|nr:hypothetical protein HK098_004959 [Nowakowskiella sp. JEL0407]